MRIRKDRLFFDRIFSLLLVLDGIGAGLGVRGAACVFLLFQDCHNGIDVPAIGGIGCQRYAVLALGFLHSLDFSAGISRIKLIGPVLDTCKIIVGVVGIGWRQDRH